MTVLGTDKPCLLKCPQLIGETFQIELEFWTCWQTGVSGEKLLVADNQQQTQPQLNTGTLPQATLVDGECSHNWAIPSNGMLFTSALDHLYSENKSTKTCILFYRHSVHTGCPVNQVEWHTHPPLQCTHEEIM